MSRKKSSEFRDPKTNERLIPTGECWCGCGQEPSLGSFFVHGHDKRASGRAIVRLFGGLPVFLKVNGFFPGGEKWEEWRKASAEREGA